MGAGPGGISFLCNGTGLLACPLQSSLIHFDHSLGKSGTTRNVRPTQPPWHLLYFFPEPQGQGSLRPTFAPTLTAFGASPSPAPVLSSKSLSSRPFPRSTSPSPPDHSPAP